MTWRRGFARLLEMRFYSGNSWETLFINLIAYGFSISGVRDVLSGIVGPLFLEHGRSRFFRSNTLIV